MVSQLSSYLEFESRRGLRRNLPYGLACEIEDARQKCEEVEKVSVGLDDDWFLRTDARYGMSFPHASPAFPSLPQPLAKNDVRNSVQNHDRNRPDLKHGEIHADRVTGRPQPGRI